MELLLRSESWLQRAAYALLFLFFFIIPYITDAFITFEMRFRDQVEKFTSDENYYLGLRQFQAGSIGAITYLPDTNLLLVGARNSFYKIDLTNSFGDRDGTMKVNWTVQDQKVNDCLRKGQEEWECQNFIQVIQYDETSNQLHVCGTGAQDPVCRIYMDYTDLTMLKEMDGKRKCPFDPMQQSTALMAGGALYTATVGDYSGRDSLVYRSSIGESDIVELRSREADAKWFNSPVFIESFEVDEWVLIFFREIAVEHINSGDAIYARVGKVCKSDMGGAYVLEEKWTTYQKARLNCSFPGAYPFYFNYLQDVFEVVEGDKRMFYGVFSTGEHEIPGSAVCAFDMDAIREIFNEGQFKEQNSGNWYALPRDMEKDPRPGNCSLNSKRQSDDNLEFITNHPLMDDSVPSYGDPFPIFDLTRADYRLTQIAVHQQMGKRDKLYHILYLGTENGVVLKVALIPEGDKFKSNLLEKIYVTPRDCQEKVKELKIIKMLVDGNEKDVLLVVTNSTLVEVPLQRCHNYTTSCSCKQDPFCVWNTINVECYEYVPSNNNFDDQDVTNIEDCVEEGPSKVVPVVTKRPAGSGKEESKANIGAKASSGEFMLVFLIVGWALFLISLPVIIFLIMSKRSNNGNYVATAGEERFMGSNSKQKTDGENKGTPPNGHCTYHHLSPPASLQESSTDPITSERQYPSLTLPRAANLERGTPQGAIRTQSLSRKKPSGPPPVPPKRTNSVLSHNGPRCPLPNSYVRSARRGSNPTTPTKMRQNSSSSSESSDREPPPYSPLSSSDDGRRRRPSGASNNEVPPEYGRDWYPEQARSQEQSV